MILVLLVDPSSLPLLALKGMQLALPIFQGGMGVGVSLAPLASAVAVAGGLGLVSSAGLDRIVSKRLGRKVGIYEAVRLEVEAAKARGGFAGVNIMVALQRDFVASVRAALDAGADAIVSGAGLPLSLPSDAAGARHRAHPDRLVRPRAGDHLPALGASARRPDAVVLEGPLAGGHLGFRADQVDLEENTLERLLPPVKEVAMAHGDLPVIVAGGVYSHEDIRRFIALGADGVQMGTRFLATEESSASPAYKAAVLRARPEDMVVANAPGSPCGLPFRVLRESPMYQEALVQGRPPRCAKGYVLFKDADGRFTQCAAKDDNEHFFCICEGLFSAAGYERTERPLYTAGTTAARVDRILSTSDSWPSSPARRRSCPWWPDRRFAVAPAAGHAPREPGSGTRTRRRGWRSSDRETSTTWSSSAAARPDWRPPCTRPARA